MSSDGDSVVDGRRVLFNGSGGKNLEWTATCLLVINVVYLICLSPYARHVHLKYIMTGI